MNGAAGSQMVEVGELAARQLKDYDSHQPGMLFAEGCVLDVSQGYELQNAVAKLRFQRGERLIGYKVGNQQGNRFLPSSVRTREFLPSRLEILREKPWPTC